MEYCLLVLYLRIELTTKVICLLYGKETCGAGKDEINIQTHHSNLFLLGQNFDILGRCLQSKPKTLIYIVFD